MKQLKVKVSRGSVPFSKDILPDDGVIRFGIVRRISTADYDSKVKEVELDQFVYVHDHLVFRDGGFDTIDDYDENGQVWLGDRVIAEIIFVTTAVSFDGLLDKYRRFNAFGLGECEWTRYNKGELPSA